MIHNFYPPSLKALVFFSLFFLTIFSIPAMAQKGSPPGINSDGDFVNGSGGGSFGGGGEENWGLAFNAGYETPLGELKDIYKGTPTLGLTLFKNYKTFTFSGTADYRSYKPVDDSIKYDEGIYAKYSNYTGIGLYFSAVYNLQLGDRLKLYGGLVGGAILSKYSISFLEDGQETVGVSSSTSVSYLGPKGGFNYLLTDRIGLGLEAKYTLGVVGADYNTRTGGTVKRGHSTYAGNVVLTYNF